MKKTLESVVYNPWLIIIVNTCSIGGFLFSIQSHLNGYPLNSPFLYLTITFIIILFSIGLYSLKENKKRQSYIKIFKNIHHINHKYRDTLFKIFNLSNQLSNNDLLHEQSDILSQICQIIRDIYQELIQRPCVVTLKLIKTDRDPNEKVCETYVRSDCVQRDDLSILEYKIGTNANTAFDVALKINHDFENCSHFFSGDLGKMKEYNNERPNWNKMYKSAIVVPIRALVYKNKTIIHCDEIGFLCVDTKYINRLNDDDHVQILAAFADQMYNFISLMSRKYLTNNTLKA
jgi:hypothetical protein